MPRSRTRARQRAAKLAAGLIQPDPERTPAALRAWWRAVWKNIAAHEDYPQPWLEPRTRRERSAAIREALYRWVIGAATEMAKEEARAQRRRQD